MNIPIYRAKKIDNDEYVFFNSFYEYENKYYAINKIINQTIDGWFTNVMIPLTYKINPTTLAIHFPGMLDSQGKEIFASLSEDGKGGDIFQYNKFTAYRELDNAVNTVVINQGRHALLIGDNFHSLFAIQGKVTGIQE